MDFFEAQDQARRRTKWLVLWFILAMLGVVAAVNLLIFIFFGDGGGVGIMIPASVGTAGIILAASGFKSMQLSSGGAVVAQDLGGRLVMPGTTDFEEKQLLNVVEEMAIASGMPVPQVYIMDNEESINAFAAGTEPSNAVIGVTRGCLQILSRDELEGVIAHEFSHILNGDMRLNMRLIGLLFGLMVISIIGRGLFEVMQFSALTSRRDREGGGGAMAFFLLGLGLMIIGSIGVFFGRLIQAAISRQREYLADASAVQFTRNPDGIANALKKIGGLSQNKMAGPISSLDHKQPKHQCARRRGTRLEWQSLHHSQRRSMASAHHGQLPRQWNLAFPGLRERRHHLQSVEHRKRTARPAAASRRRHLARRQRMEWTNR